MIDVISIAIIGLKAFVFKSLKDTFKPIPTIAIINMSVVNVLITFNMASGIGMNVFTALIIKNPIKKYGKSIFCDTLCDLFLLTIIKKIILNGINRNTLPNFVNKPMPNDDCPPASAAKITCAISCKLEPDQIP